VLKKLVRDKGGSVAGKYFVLCACRKRELFSSPKEAADAWNKANVAAFL
jgi:hypothetical protein